MREILCGVLLLSVIMARLYGQTTEETRFNEAFLHIYMQTASKDVNLALQSADSLYRTAVSDVQKIRSLMLVSDMYHRLMERDSSILYAVEAERIAERTDDYVWQARICGVLSTQYRETGLLHEGKRYLKKGLKIIERVENPEMANQFKGQCYQEMGFYAIEEQQYREAIGYFKQAAPFLRTLKTSKSRDFSLAQNEERLGLCYLKSDAIDSAKKHYETALMLVQKASDADTPLKGFIYSGLGRVWLEEGKYGQADSCLKAALDIAETSGFPHLKISVYGNLATYEQLTGNDEGYRDYNEKYLGEIKKNMAKHRRYADNILVRAREQISAMAASNQILGVTVFVILLLAAAGITVYINRQRKQHSRYKEVIDRLWNVPQQVPADLQPVAVASPIPNREKDFMPESTKQELLKKLSRFESSQQFTDRNISIAVLAGKMKTNTKYLSYIINNYRNKDFNGYINELRISYIVAKMEADSRYLNYKISYLAEECGFATHSQFTTVFKHITGLSPSKFIAYLKKDEKGANTTLVG